MTFKNHRELQRAEELYYAIERIRRKLIANGKDPMNYDECIEFLGKQNNPSVYIEIYEGYINY